MHPVTIDLAEGRLPGADPWELQVLQELIHAIISDRTHLPQFTPTIAYYFGAARAASTGFLYRLLPIG